MHKYIGVTFIGSKPQVDAFVPSRGPPIQELKVEADKIFRWLRFLKDVNPLYYDIVIDDSKEMRKSLENISTEILNRATAIEDDVTIRIEQLVARGDLIEKIPEINDECQESISGESSDMLPVVLVTREEIPVPDEDAPATHIFNSLLRSLSSNETEASESTMEFNPSEKQHYEDRN